MKPNFLFEVLRVCEILGAVVPVECLTVSVAVTRTQSLQGICLKKIKGNGSLHSGLGASGMCCHSSLWEWIVSVG